MPSNLIEKINSKMIKRIAKAILSRISSRSKPKPSERKILNKKDEKDKDLKLLELYGHKRTREERIPIDAGGEPLPWITYPLIEYLNQFDFSEFSIFEFGAGYSSIYFSKRFKKVKSVDDNEEWVDKIKSLNLKNLEIYHETDKEKYLAKIQDDHYDVVLIDGKYRHDSAQKVLDKLPKPNTIIFDNSDWFPESCKLIRNSGYTQIDFKGFAPIIKYQSSSSIFILENHCFKKPKDIQPTSPIGGKTMTFEKLRIGNWI